jgi:hypothetical protein
MIFERRILRKIFGPVQERDGWKFRTNHEFIILIGGSNVYESSTTERVGPFT